MEQNVKTQLPKEWETVKTYPIEGTATAVRVQKLSLGIPRYRMVWGDVKGDGTVAGNITIKLDRENHVISVAPEEGILIDTFKLVETAWKTGRNWIRDNAQITEDEFVARKIHRDQKAINFGKQVTRVTGKTARKKNKNHKPEPQVNRVQLTVVKS